jgi:hypothetical protein
VKGRQPPLMACTSLRDWNGKRSVTIEFYNRGRFTGVIEFHGVPADLEGRAFSALANTPEQLFVKLAASWPELGEQMSLLRVSLGDAKLTQLSRSRPRRDKPAPPQPSPFLDLFLDG